MTFINAFKDLHKDSHTIIVLHGGSAITAMSALCIGIGPQYPVQCFIAGYVLSLCIVVYLYRCIA